MFIIFLGFDFKANSRVLDFVFVMTPCDLKGRHQQLALGRQLRRAAWPHEGSREWCRSTDWRYPAAPPVSCFIIAQSLPGMACTQEVGKSGLRNAMTDYLVGAHGLHPILRGWAPVPEMNKKLKNSFACYLMLSHTSSPKSFTYHSA